MTVLLTLLAACVISVLVAVMWPGTSAVLLLALLALGFTGLCAVMLVQSRNLRGRHRRRA